MSLLNGVVLVYLLSYVSLLNGVVLVYFLSRRYVLTKLRVDSLMPSLNRMANKNKFIDCDLTSPTKRLINIYWNVTKCLCNNIVTMVGQCLTHRVVWLTWTKFKPAANNSDDKQLSWSHLPPSFHLFDTEYCTLMTNDLR